MSLSLALSIAQSGLALVQRQVSQTASNITNAATEGYTRKTVGGSALVVEGLASGVRSQEAQRSVDAALTASMNGAISSQAAAKVREALLQPIEQVQGDPESGQSVADLTSALRSAFVALRAAPGESSLQDAVVSAAGAVAQRYNETSAAIQTARQTAQDGAVTDVATLNASLSQVAGLNTRIASLQAQGLSTADLQDQRDSAITRIAGVVPVKSIAQDNGTVVLVAGNGLVLPLDKDSDAFSMASATVGLEDWYGADAGGMSGSLPGILMGGTDVTAQLTGGSLGANISMRDEVLPLQQAELDSAAAGLASRLSEQGLALFTDAGGAVPDPAQGYVGGIMGFAATMTVSATVSADASTVRDGTDAAMPADGTASYTDGIDRVLDYAFGSRQASGSAQAAFLTTGLGPSGKQVSSLSGAGTAEDYAARLVARHTGARAAASADAESATTMLTGLQQRHDDASGVDIDTETVVMVSLQSAYAANARMLSAVQSMYDDLFAAVQ